MFKIIRQHPKAFALAIGVHVAVLGLLVASFDWTPKPRMTLKTDEEIVQAVAVDESQVQAEIDRLKKIEDKKRRAEQARIKKLEEKADKAKKARENEQKRLAELEAQRKIEAEKKSHAEKERIAAEKASRLAQAEKEQLEKARSTAEAQKRIAEEQKKQAEELAKEAREEAIKLAKEQQQREEERQRRQRMEEEAKRLQAQQAADRVAKSTVDKYRVLFKQRVEKVWIKPATAKPGMICIVLVRLSPVGDVLSASVITGSGDAIYDRSVETAVFQATPFDVPKDPEIFSNYFREFHFKFNPEQ